MLRTAACLAALSTILIAGCSSGDDSATADASSTTATTSSATASSAPTTSSGTAATSSTESGGDTSTPEAAFVTALRNASIPVRNDEGVIGTGQRMCEALTNGGAVDAAAAFGTDENPWSPEQARAAVSVAATTLCPENAGKVG